MKLKFNRIQAEVEWLAVKFLNDGKNWSEELTGMCGFTSERRKNGGQI